MAGEHSSGKGDRDRVVDFKARRDGWDRIWGKPEHRDDCLLYKGGSKCTCRLTDKMDNYEKEISKRD